MFLKTVMFIVALIAMTCGGCATGETPLSDENQNSQAIVSDSGASLREARFKAARRQRRVIYNDDSEELRYVQGGTVDGFLSVRLKPLVGTQVDTICWSALGIWGDAPVFDSKLQPLFGDAHSGKRTGYEHYEANTKNLIKAGHCPLRLVIEFSHLNGIEAFASIRMNDVHDSFVPGIKTNWKRNHPEYLVSSGGEQAVHKLYATAQDYSHGAVRMRKFEIIEEVCERYDIDGVELDYLRHPVLFSSVMQGRAATDKEVAIMTSFMVRIRERMDEIAARRKRPLLLAARVPDTIELSKRIGLDVETWLKRDLVDLLFIGGGYAPFSLSVADIAKVAHRHDVPVYPCINWGPLRDFTSEAEFRQGARSLAAKWLGAGADGIYLWNLGTSFLNDRGQTLVDKRRAYYASLNDIGELATLHRKDKLYAIDGPVFAPYVLISTQAPLPVTLRRNAVRRLPLAIADDIAMAARAGSLRGLQLRLQLEGAVRKDSLVVRLNDRDLADGKMVQPQPDRPEYWLGFSLTASSLKKGANIVEASLKSAADVTATPVKLRRVHLAVKYR